MAEADFAQVVAKKLPYYAKRVELFDQFLLREKDNVEKAKETNVPIVITLPDGSQKEGVKGATTPMDVALLISKSLAKKTVVAKVDCEVWDMFRPLEGNCSLELCGFDSSEGKDVRTSSE